MFEHMTEGNRRTGRKVGALDFPITKLVFRTEMNLPRYEINRAKFGTESSGSKWGDSP